MGRPRLPVGAHGNVRTKRVGKHWVAATRVRDADGRRREVKRSGRTADEARYNLQDALKERPAFGGSDLSGDSLLADVATAWIDSIDHQVAVHDRAPTTARVYRGVLNGHVLPALGQLTVREAASVTRCDMFLRSMRTHHGAALTKTTRTVLNGVLGYAVRHGLIPANPMRDVGRIRGDRAKKQPRGLTEVEREKWLAAMDGDEVAIKHDLPDLTRMLLATGCRIGEMLALSWDDVDIDNKQVHIDWTIIRLEKGGGLVRSPTKTAAGERTLPLPGWAVDVLTRRHEKAAGRGPVFPDAKGGWRDPSNTSRSLRQARERAGFGWITSHTFRRTVATTLHDSGFTPRGIADQLGHANLRTVESYIGRAAVSRAAAEALEVAWLEGESAT
jgi:integrase